MENAYIVRIDEDGTAEIQLLDSHLIHVIEWTAENQWEHKQFPEGQIDNTERLSQELTEAIESETTVTKEELLQEKTCPAITFIEEVENPPECKFMEKAKAWGTNIITRICTKSTTTGKKCYETAEEAAEKCLLYEREVQE